MQIKIKTRKCETI